MIELFGSMESRVLLGYFITFYTTTFQESYGLEFENNELEEWINIQVT